MVSFSGLGRVSGAWRGWVGWEKNVLERALRSGWVMERQRERKNPVMLESQCGGKLKCICTACPQGGILFGSYPFGQSILELSQLVNTPCSRTTAAPVLHTRWASLNGSECFLLKDRNLLLHDSCLAVLPAVNPQVFGKIHEQLPESSLQQTKLAIKQFPYMVPRILTIITGLL